MNELAAIILAAGKGTRMKSHLVKVMHPIAGLPMLAYPIQSARQAGVVRIVVVTGHQAESVRDYLSKDPKIAFAKQREQLGTGHAVAIAGKQLQDFRGTVLILCGDVPLIAPATLQAMVSHHKETAATLTVMTARLATPYGYGRVIRKGDGTIERIVEEKDATPAEREINEINAGIYCADAGFLFSATASITNNNAQGEYYLTDIIATASSQGLRCSPFPVEDPQEIMGINDRTQLADAARITRDRIAQELMQAGTTLVDPATAYIDAGIRIGRDTVVHPNVHLYGATEIGAGCILEPSVIIRDCRIGNNVTVKSGSVLEESTVHDHVSIGPMAHLRPGTELLNRVKIGNFVETKKIVMGEGSKASHLTYLGDATIGSNVNVGCGTITCNYDGVSKHRTVIEDDVFVGSDVQFVAPVTIGRNSLIAAGTTITKDVPPDSLAIARTPQVNKDGWKLKKRN